MEAQSVEPVLISRLQLQENQWIPPELPPVAIVDGVEYWPLTAVESLKTRRAWKRLNRYIQKGAEPLVVIPEESLRLYARSQTISEEENHARRLEGVMVHVRQWQHERHVWDDQVAQWRLHFDQVGPQAEGELQEIYRRWKVLHHQWHSFPQEILPPEAVEKAGLNGWHKVMTAYQRARFAVVAGELAESDHALATLVDEKLCKSEELPQKGHALPLLPYWAYYGKFYKEMESARLARDVEEATRIRHFHLLFPAREMQRHFTLYLGPTNSGKTYQALQRLAKAKNGVYLAPLRLLALEVMETLNQWGVPCSMVTGEERILVPGANHVACTVEMLPLHQHYDICVIDECQMLGDADRGWAWTQAILGVMADEVCLLGAPEAKPVLSTLLDLTRDPYQVEELQRLSPLHFLDKPVKMFEELEPGTAVVAFSRAGVLGLKEEIERYTGKRCAVLYGALPPEVRREQARLFASGETPYLAATDAIGMGLNLPIKTLLFAQDRKMIDRQEVPLTPMEVRQIAGRAGRFGKNEMGYVGVFRISPLTVKETFLRDPPAIRRAHLAPNLDHLLAIASLQEDKKQDLTRLLSLFVRTVRPDPQIYRLARLEDQIVLAKLADRHEELDLETRFQLSAAPVPLSSAPAVSAYTRMVETVAHAQSREVDYFLPPSDGRAARLESLETSMRIVNLYSWLHYRFSDRFPDLEGAVWKRREINRGINIMLTQSRKSSRGCADCHKPLPVGHTFAICDECWKKGRAARHSHHRWQRPRSHHRGS